MRIQKSAIILVAIVSMIIYPLKVKANLIDNEEIKVQIISEEALTDDEIKDLNEIADYGVKKINNSDITVYKTSVPTEGWDFSKGNCSFKGTATNTDLYTNYFVTGSSQYTVVIDNLGKESLTVNVKKTWGGTVRTMTIDPGARRVASISGFKVTDHMYLQFKVPCNVSGYIKIG